MNDKFYVTKNFISKFSIIALSLCLLGNSNSASASPDCNLRGEELKVDSQLILQKLQGYYAEDIGTFPNEEFARAELKTDAPTIEPVDGRHHRLNMNLPILNQMKSVGMITNTPFKGELNYGSAVKVSPCHVIANHHTIVSLAENGDSRNLVKNGYGQSNYLNTNIYFHGGQGSCDSGTTFQNKNQNGTVAAVGNAPGAKYIPGKDWAIVKLNGPQDSNSQTYVQIQKFSPSGDELMILASYQGQDIKNDIKRDVDGFNYPRGNFMRSKNWKNDGSLEMTSDSEQAGSSGGGVFWLGNRFENNKVGAPEVTLYAINVGSNLDNGLTTVLPIVNILAQLRLVNAPLYHEVIKANKTGICE